MRSCTSIWRRILLLAVLPLLTETTAEAQTETGSPFSVKGLGEIQPRNFARNFGMGGVGIALPAYSGVDPSNPGHYGNLEEPGFDIGVTHQRLSVRKGDIRENKKNTQLQNIAFGFPASDRWTLTLGIDPMIQRNYSIRDTLTREGIGEYARAYEGKGRLQELYMGNGYNIIQQGDSLTLGIGFHLSYLFGELKKERRTEFENAGVFNTRSEEDLGFSSFKLDAGLHFQKRFGLHSRKNSDEMVPLRLMSGLTVDLPRDMEMRRDHLAVTYASTSTRDTTSYVNAQDIPFHLPLGYGGGLAFIYDEKLKGSFEYRTRKWSDLNEEAEAILFPEEKTRDRRSMRLGFEYTPRREFARTSSYFAYWDYRLGARSIQEYYSYDGRKVQDLGISFGLGIPLVRSSSHSTIDIGAEWSRRGPQGSGTLLRERAWKFYVGVSLAPHRADQWFRKPKIR